MDDELIDLVDEMSDYIMSLAPDVRVVKTGETFEDEHANLEVYPPLAWSEPQCRGLQLRISERAVDVHMETGYLILTYVCTPAQQVAEASLVLGRAAQHIQKAERVLAEARSLGLYRVESEESRLVPA